MNKGLLTVGIILLSLIALLMINVLTNYSTGGDLDYYLVKETVDAAMIDAVDDVYLRTCGLYRIDKEKLVENFVYRFANSVDTTRNYTISFYDINEVPPKVSVRVESSTVLAVNNKNANKQDAGYISTSYDAILETPYYSNISVEEGLRSNNSEVKGYEQCQNLLNKNKMSN